MNIRNMQIGISFRYDAVSCFIHSIKKMENIQNNVPICIQHLRSIHLCFMFLKGRSKPQVTESVPPQWIFLSKKANVMVGEPPRRTNSVAGFF